MVNPHTPPADVEINDDLVQTLLEAQFPQHANLALRKTGEGWDNVTYRLGEHLGVRLPRRVEARSLLLHERRWLPEVTLTDGISAPVPLAHGQPDSTYPYPWNLFPWQPGEAASAHCLDAEEAVRLAQCLRRLHQSAPAQMPRNPVRGVPLAQRQDSVEERLTRLRQHADWQEGNIGRHWQAALAAPAHTHPALLHGDLHPLNLLHQAGRITALIDWGDITAGDTATDLASLWMLFEDRTLRQQALDSYGAPPALIARARGWALLFGVVLAEAGATGDPRHASVGWATLNRLAVEPLDHHA